MTLRNSEESLQRLVRLGVEINTVFDVGASVGTPSLYSTFPNSHHVMVEPIEENAPYLKRVCDELSHANFLIAAVSDKSAEGKLFVQQDLLYSTLTTAARTDSKDIRTVTTITVDDLCSKFDCSPPYLLKIDVDGQETKVLEGAKQTLANTEAVLIEVVIALDKTRIIMNQLWDAGFELYDIVEPLMRPLDDGLWQVDMLFVKKNSPLRKSLEFGVTSTKLKNWRESTIKQVAGRFKKKLWF